VAFKAESSTALCNTPINCNWCDNEGLRCQLQRKLNLFHHRASGVDIMGAPLSANVFHGVVFYSLKSNEKLGMRWKIISRKCYIIWSEQPKNLLK
jgi:hypothetical protein